MKDGIQINSSNICLYEKILMNRKKIFTLCIVSQDNLKNKGFGQDLPTVENEVEEHNIFQSEVEALAPHINADVKVSIKIVKTEQRSSLSIKVSTVGQ